MEVKNTRSFCLLFFLIFQAFVLFTVGQVIEKTKVYQCITLHENNVAGLNVLTQNMLTQENTVYEIRSHYHIHDSILYIPRNSILKFNGGSVSNGTIIGNYTKIESTSSFIFRNMTLQGSWAVEDIYTYWFDFNKAKDDYHNFQNLIVLTDDAVQNNIFFENKEFYTSKKNHLLKLKSNTSLYLDKSVIRILPNKDKNFCVIDIRGVHNVSIFGGTIIGDIEHHVITSGSTDEWNHGIRISGSNNVRIQDTKSMYNMGDGVDIIDKTNSDKSVSLSENIILENVICDNNGRQGFSIEGARNVVMKHCKGINTGQIRFVKPSLGLDIEPWRKEGLCTNIDIINCEFSNNRANDTSLDIIIQPNYLLKKNEEPLNSIFLKDCVISSNIYVRNSKGLVLDNLSFSRRGILSIDECSNIQVSNISNLEKMSISNSNQLSTCNISTDYLNFIGISNLEGIGNQAKYIVARESSDLIFKESCFDCSNNDSNKNLGYFDDCKNIEFLHCSFKDGFIRTEGVLFNKFKILNCSFNYNDTIKSELRISNVSNIEKCTFNTCQEVVISNPANSICVVYDNKWIQSSTYIKKVAMRVHNNNNAVLYFINNMIYGAEHALALDFGTEIVNYYSSFLIKPYDFSTYSNFNFLEGSVGIVNNRKGVFINRIWSFDYVSNSSHDKFNFDLKPITPNEGGMYQTRDGIWLIYQKNTWKHLQNF